MVSLFLVLGEKGAAGGFVLFNTPTVHQQGGARQKGRG